MNVDIDISKVFLKTQRLSLRPFKMSDLEDFYEYAKVDGVGQMAGWRPHENIEVSKIILKDFINGKKTFALVYQGKVIGSLGIEKYNEELMPEFEYLKGREIGFVLAKDYWGNGLMPEAVNEVLRYLFEEVELDFITCGHFLDNTRSSRVQTKCGFKKYKQNDHYMTRMGDIKKEQVNILFKVQWQDRSR